MSFFSGGSKFRVNPKLFRLINSIFLMKINQIFFWCVLTICCLLLVWVKEIRVWKRKFDNHTGFEVLCFNIKNHTFAHYQKSYCSFGMINMDTMYVQGLVQTKDRLDKGISTWDHSWIWRSETGIETPV